jgi:hypothetical protein
VATSGMTPSSQRPRPSRRGKRSPWRTRRPSFAPGITSFPSRKPTASRFGRWIANTARSGKASEVLIQ